jgi:hypothetical protein
MILYHKTKEVELGELEKIYELFDHATFLLNFGRDYFENNGRFSATFSQLFPLLKTMAYIFYQSLTGKERKELGYVFTTL